MEMKDDPALKQSKSLDSLQSLPPTIDDVDRWKEIPGLSPEFGNFNKPFGELIPDCIMFIVLCTQHRNVLLSRVDKGNYLYLPFWTLRSGETWKNAAYGCISVMLLGDDADVLKTCTKELTYRQAHVLRVQIPESGKFATRMIYEVRVNGSFGKFKCCRPDPQHHRHVWMPATAIAENLPYGTQLYGGEVFVFDLLFGKGDNWEFLQEWTTEDTIRYHPEPKQHTKYKALVESAGFLAKDTIHLYTEYLEHIYPSFMMTYPSFVRYMEKAEVQGDYRAMYRAFASHRNVFLTFMEFYTGIVAMHKNASSGGLSGELRCGYIFRYYDANSDGKLDCEELKRMVSDMRRTDANVSEAVIEEDTRKYWNKMHTDERMKHYQVKGKNDAVPLLLFAELVAKLEIRGTSSLFRMPQDGKSLKVSSAVRSGSEKGAGSLYSNIVHRRVYKGTCLSCQLLKYEHE